MEKKSLDLQTLLLGGASAFQFAKPVVGNALYHLRQRLHPESATKSLAKRVVEGATGTSKEGLMRRAVSVPLEHNTDAARKLGEKFRKHFGDSAPNALRYFHHVSRGRFEEAEAIRQKDPAVREGLRKLLHTDSPQTEAFSGAHQGKALIREATSPQTIREARGKPVGKVRRLTEKALKASVSLAGMSPAHFLADNGALDYAQPVASRVGSKVQPLVRKALEKLHMAGGEGAKPNQTLSKAKGAASWVYDNGFGNNLDRSIRELGNKARKPPEG